VGIDQTTPGTTNKVSIGTDGTVAATQSGTWNIGTLTSITNALPTGSNTLGGITLTDGTNGIVMVTGSADATSATSNRIPVQAHNKSFNGSTWDLNRSGITASGSTFTGFQNQLPIGIYNSSFSALTTGQGAPLQLTTNGSLKVDLGGTGANATAIKVDGSAVTQPVSGNVGQIPLTSGGTSVYKNLDTNNAGYTVKGSAGQLYRGQFTNNATSIRYLKFWNKTSPAVGTDATTFTIGLPPSSAGNLAFPEQGVAFSTAISVACTTGFADNNSGAPTANDVIISLYYF
jgi:hypothetical protein